MSACYHAHMRYGYDSIISMTILYCSHLIFSMSFYGYLTYSSMLTCYHCAWMRICLHIKCILYAHIGYGYDSMSAYLSL